MKKIIKILVILLTILFTANSNIFAEEKKEDFSKYKLENINFLGNVGVIKGDLYHLKTEYFGLDTPSVNSGIFKNFQKQKNTKNVEDLYFYKNKIFYLIKEENKFYFKYGNKILGEKFDYLDDVSFDKKGNIYAIGKNNLVGKVNSSYFLTKNGKKISNDFEDLKEFSIKNLNTDNTFVEKKLYKYKKYFIKNNNFYILELKEGEDIFYKNNEKIFKLGKIDKIYYNNILKKFYFQFTFDELKGIFDGKEIIISNFLDKNFPKYIDLKFSKDGKSIILFSQDEEKNKKIYKIIGKISEEEKKEFLEDLKKEEEYDNFKKNNIDFNKYIKFGFYGDRYEKKFYSTDKRFIFLKKWWKKYYSKHKEKLTEKKLNLLVKKIANKMEKTENLKNKEIYLFLLLIIKDTSLDLENKRHLKESEDFLKNYKNKEIGFEYEPMYYIMDAVPIDIINIKKTYDKENNRFILEVESVLDKDERASAYYWWSASNGYFKEYDDEKYIKENGEFKRVYFYPASSEPLNDYQIKVSGGDNLGFVDESGIIIKKDEFNYKKFNSSKVKNKLEIIKSDKYIFGTSMFNITIKAEEDYSGKKFGPENYSVYLKKVDGEEVDKKLVAKGDLEGLVIGKDKTIIFGMFGYEQQYEYFGKNLEFELELSFPHSVKSVEFSSIYLPQFRISGDYYDTPELEGFIKNIYIGDFVLRDYDDNEIFLFVPNDFVQKKYEEYLKKGKKGDFEINLKAGFELYYYGKIDTKDIKLNFNSYSKYIDLFLKPFDLDKKKIEKIKNQYARKYFESVLDYKENFKEILNQMKKDLETKEKNNLELQNLYLKILNNTYLK